MFYKLFFLLPFSSSSPEDEDAPVTGLKMKMLMLAFFTRLINSQLSWTKKKNTVIIIPKLFFFCISAPSPPAPRKKRKKNLSKRICISGTEKRFSRRDEKQVIEKEKVKRKLSSFLAPNGKLWLNSVCCFPYFEKEGWAGLVGRGGREGESKVFFYSKQKKSLRS